jgi:hypothetical protein
MIKNALVAALVAVSMPAIAGTSGKAPVMPPPTAPAPSSISYDYFEAGYVRGFDAVGATAGVAIGPFLFVDSDVADTDGYNIGLSKTLAGNLYGFANFGQSFADLSLFGQSVDAEVLNASAGLGYHIPLTSSIDFVAQVGAAYLDRDLSGNGLTQVGTTDQWGAVGAVGFRAALTNWLELNLFYTPSYFEEDDFQNAGSANLIFRNVISNVDLVLSGSVNEEFETVGAGLRYNF